MQTQRSNEGFIQSCWELGTIFDCLCWRQRARRSFCMPSLGQADSESKLPLSAKPQRPQGLSKEFGARLSLDSMIRYLGAPERQRSTKPTRAWGPGSIVGEFLSSSASAV